MNNNLLVSIIIPVYNGEKWLAGAVRSALNQTYSNIEIIIINDGSSDKSLELCKSFSYDSRVSIIDKDNGGQASARNRGLVEAKGDFILFLDCDDTLQPNAVEVCLNAVNESTDFVLFGFNVYNNGGKLSEEEVQKILSTPGKGYGIYNIQERIRMYYDEECGIFSHLTEEGLVCFTIKIRKMII